MDEKCENCRFYRVTDDQPTGSQGECRRHWPGRGMWPMVTAGDWCGDWDRNPAEEERRWTRAIPNGPLS